MSPAARITRSGERAVLGDLDRRDAAEVKIPPAPADELVPEALQPVELRRVGAALAVQMALVEMDTRCRDRVLDAAPSPRCRRRDGVDR